MNKLLWVDLEMTGLDVEKEVIIEVAAIITDLKLESLASYHSVVKQDQKHLDAMDDWNTTHHGNSGLTALVPTGGDPQEVEKDLIRFCKEHFSSDEKIILAGNSIGQDRLFINKYFKDFATLLHYRMLDVSSFKIWFQAVYNKEFKKQNTHRALDDIQESINELKFYNQLIPLQPL